MNVSADDELGYLLCARTESTLISEIASLSRITARRVVIGDGAPWMFVSSLSISTLISRGLLALDVLLREDSDTAAADAVDATDEDMDGGVGGLDENVLALLAREYGAAPPPLTLELALDAAFENRRSVAV